ncbi:GNAT family N-acetyltransferase [Caloranaerobacter ferrireducens]|uniref:GNAT family N-acetyltransferase n=1 Tax=Caloranaerobacter ferrireducens TaxID=1323370 RepID=UPI00084DFEAC|nr:GNAT family N-acetyltransferase [Caloranaerobacter ferrireducens]
MIRYCTDKKVDFEKLIELFKQVGWDDKTRDIKRLKAMVDNSQIVVTAWKDEEMIGFARCVTDFVFNGQINNVVVDTRYRGKGIGKELIKKILDSSKQVTYILRGDLENEGFYRKLGFEEAQLSFVYKRKE